MMNENETPIPRKSRFLLVCFSLVPGAGHMYMGWLRRGLELMSLCAGAIYLGYALGLEMFAFAVPIIWFYSLFDALQLASAGPATPPQALPSLLNFGDRTIGIALIVLGGAMLVERIAIPLLGILNHRFVNMARTGIVAALFILGGLRLAFGQKERQGEEQ